MERNFFRRVEIAFPVLREQHRDRIFRDLEAYLEDNVNAWELRPDGTYERVAPGQDAPREAQQMLLERYTGAPSFDVEVS
jgi:polyphosphate kinase